MSDIPTWAERCEAHPDHQSGMVTNAMIKMRMQEEINDLRDELNLALDENTKIHHSVSAHWFLDPPDGGSVSTAEGVKRIEDEVNRLRAENAQQAGEIARLREALTPFAEAYPRSRKPMAWDDAVTGPYVAMSFFYRARKALKGEW